MSLTHLTRIVALSVLCVLPTSGFSATLTVQDILGTFNAVTQSNTGSQEIEGRTYISGDLVGITGQFGFDVTPDGSGLSNLYVDGDLINSTINLTTAATASVSGTASGSTVNNGTLTTGATDFPMIDFAALAAESMFLASLTGTAADIADPNHKSFGGPENAVGAEAVFGPFTTVLTASLADLATGGYSIDFDPGDTVLINVSGISGAFGMNPLGGINGAENVLWNFYEAQNIQVNSPIQGHVLAANAIMSGFNGSTEGTVIARAIHLTNGELHTRAWAGTVPTEVAAVPLPAGLPLLALGIAALGLMRRQTA